jgi:DNA-binding NarL/FixJ family response regulator
VLRGIAEGKSNKEIARDLDLQEVTIKLHVKTLCRKLDARNRTHAVIIAQNMNLL